MYNKRFFQIIKEKIIEIRNVRKESAVRKIRVTKPYYYNINKRLQFLSKIVNITSKKNKISKLNKKTIRMRIFLDVEMLLIFNYKEYKVPKVKYMKKDSLETKIVYYEKKISSITNQIIYNEYKHSNIIK